MSKLKKLFNKYKKIPIAVRATIWFVVANVLQKGMSIIVTPIFTRMMQPEQYGQFSVYNSWLQIFTILTTLRLNYAVFNKGMSKYKNDRENYVSTMQTITLILTLIVFVIYLIFQKPLNKMIELPTFIMSAMFIELMVTPAISFWTSRKRYEYQYKQVVIRTVGFTIFNALLGIAAVYFSKEKGYARIISCVVANVCFGLPLFIYNRRRATTWFNEEYARFAIGFNLPLLIHYFAQYALDQSDRILIQKLVDTASTGIYSVAYQAGMILKILTTSIFNALIPWQFERLEKKEIKELDNVLFIIYVLVAACILMFVAFAPEVIMILADKKYHEAIYVVPPVTMGLFFFFMYNTIAYVEFFYDQTKFTVYLSVAGALLNIVLNYVCIKAFGYIAAGYTTLFCYMFFWASHYVYVTHCVKKVLSIDKVFNTKRIVALSAGLLAIGIFLIFFYEQMLVRYLIIAVIVTIGFLNRNRIMKIVTDISSAKKTKKSSIKHMDGDA